jgi:histidinol-phosphate aminotransferase
MQTPDFEGLAQAGIRALRAYDPGHDIVALRRRFPGSLVELGSNESPFGPSPRAVQAIRDSLAQLHRYPDPLGSELKHALAGQLALDPAQLLLGNGSHELLMMLAQVFAGPGADVVASEFGFAVYGIAAQASAASFVRAPAFPVDASMPRGHDLEAIAAKIGPSTRLVYLANPNNPTGTWFPTRTLAAFLAAAPAHVLVVVDEAYLEFVTDPDLASAVTLLARHPNLVVTRTFSKAHGLAGLRVGYACAHPNLIAILERVRESFNVGIPGLAAAAASLADPAHLLSVRQANAVERDWLANQLRQRGCRVGPSQTNFLLLDFQRDVAVLEAGLIGRGIVLRPMAGYGLPQCLRATVGTRADNLHLLDALDGLAG